MKRTITLIVLLGWMTSGGQSLQETPPLAQPLPPNAASLFKVLDRPLGTFTGTVPISFPLCEITSGSLSASVSLDYNSTGGIAVEEQAGSVGLGFSLLDGGGRITQIVNDEPDHSSTGMLYYPNKPSNFDCNDMNHVYQAWEEFGYDLEPDLFLYQFNGQRGKFFLQEDGTVVMMQKTGIKIEFEPPNSPYPGVRQWKITDEVGNTYYFGKNKAGVQKYYIENTYTYNSSVGGSQQRPASYSWYLTEAYDLNEENKITYTYERSGSIQNSFSGGHMMLYRINWNCQHYNMNSDHMTVGSSNGEYIISRIDTDKGYIKINSSTGREDDNLNFLRKVESVQLFNKNDTMLKEFTFDYGYFNDWSSDHNEKRLKLNGFSQNAHNNSKSLDYTFEYDETYNLPSRLSIVKTDHWGFFNGQSNTSIYPNIVLKHGSTVIRRNNLANKNAYPAYTKTNVLKKITYPTGGYREFEYEGNKALTQFNPSEYHPDPSNSATRSFVETTFTMDYGSTPSLVKHFTVDSNDGGALFDYSTYFSYSCNGIHVKLFKVDTPGQNQGGFPVFEIDAEHSQQNILNGHYRMEVYRPNPNCPITAVTGTWKELTISLGTFINPHADPYASLNENNRMVGGIRIKEIRDYDPVKGETYRTQYKYKLYSVDSTKTSGLLILQPDLVALENVSGVGCLYYRMTQTSHYPLASQGGSYVVYPEVRTIENGNGWSDRKFQFAPDLPPYAYPYVPPMDNSAYRGQLLEEKIYDQNGSLLKKTKNSYTHFGSLLTQIGQKSKTFWCMQPFCSEWSDSPFFQNQVVSKSACNSFYLRGAAYDISESIETLYTPTGDFVTQTQYEYDFDDLDRMLLKRVKKTLSNGNVEVRAYNYHYTPQAEYVFGAPTSAIRTSFSNSNYLLPLEIRDSLLVSLGTDHFLGGKKFSYALTNGKIRLTREQEFKGSSLANHINYSSYSNKGKVQETYLDHGGKEVYLWGYDEQYLVARIKGSDYQTVSTMVNYNVLKDPASDLQLRTELNKIRTQLEGTAAQVTTYTYDPLIGITSITDSRGQASFYEYDEFLRLQYIRDSQGKVVTEHEYHFYNE